MADIYGDNNDNTLNGDSLQVDNSGAIPVVIQSGDDTINAGDGNDTVYGNGGTDIINGEGGDDTLLGGDGYTYWDGTQTQLVGGTDHISGGDGDDLIIAGSQNAILNGDAGHDNIQGGYGHSVINGGTGNDALSAQGSADFIFDTNFGRDTITAHSNAACTIQFNFTLAEADPKVYRNHLDLYIQTTHGWLKVNDYFANMNPGDPLMQSQFTITFDGVEVTSSMIQQAIMNGDDNDNTTGTRFEEFSTDPIVLNGGGGDDFLETSGLDNLGRTTIVDGGTGNDMYNIRSEFAVLQLSRNSGRDLLFYSENTSGQLTGLTINMDESAGAISASDLTFRFNEGLFELGIAGSDAVLVIPATVAPMLLGDTMNWKVAVGGGEILVKDLIQQLPEVVDGSLVFVAQGTTYDGEANTASENILALSGDVIMGSDNETLTGGALSITFNAGFGQDVVTAPSSSVIFAQDASEFSFTRDGYDLRVEDGSNSALLKGFFQPGRANTGDTRLTFNGTLMTFAELADALTANAGSDVIIAATDTRDPMVSMNDTSDQVIYADFDTGGDFAVSGGGTKTIYVSDQSKIGFNSLNAGTTTLVGEIGQRIAELNILADSPDDLHFSFDGADGHLRIVNTVTGSTLIVPRYAVETVNIVDQSFVSAAYSVTTSLLDDNGGYVISPVAVNNEYLLESAATDTNNTIDGRPGLPGITFGRWVTQDGKGGSDTYIGGAGSEIFVYSGGGIDVIQGMDNNAFAAIGFDIVDFAQANFTTADLIARLSRDGEDLVFQDGTDSLRIEDFFESSSQAEVTEELVKLSYHGTSLMGAPLTSTTMQAAMTFLRGLASSESPFSATRVVENLTATDGILTYADIAALFPTGGVVSTEPTEGDDVLYGTPLVDTLDALGGNDTVYGLADNDTLIGGSGNDSLHGDDGNDTLQGDAGDDTLDGGTGDDAMAGGAGNDTYVVDAWADTVTEAAGEGYDTVQAAIDYTLGAHVEELQLTGSAANGTGNAQDNVLQGNDGANRLDGGAGDDLMIGGAGNDTYVVDSADDLILEGSGQGVDTVESALDWTLGSDLENLQLTGAGNIDGTGNELANQLTGNDGANVLDGLAGNDTLSGGAGIDTLKGGTGNDIYVLDAADGGDSIVELAGEGTDMVLADRNHTLGANLENLTLTGYSDHSGTGNGVGNLIIGNDGNNTLTGGGGNDTLRGGNGDDTYVMAAGDTVDIVTELADAGTDTVRSAITWTLGSNLENLVLTGTGNTSGTGNAQDNTITGNGGNNVLNGGDGNDTLLGNGGADTLNGGNGNDVLNGGAGSDTLRGGMGDDLYIAGSGDTVIESAGQGIDTVQSANSFTLGANLENLTLTGAAATGTGNAQDNVITGNNSANTLNGGAGNDTLAGGKGNDSLVGGVGNDSYVLNRGDGRDSISENDATGGNHDTAVFGSDGNAINHDQLWFEQNNQNLVVTVIGSSDKFVVNNWFRGDARHVEEFVTSDGYHLTDTQVQNLVNAMAAFTPPPAGTSNLDAGAYGTVLDQIAASWTA
ncbi:MAG: hypothetical protein K0S46_2404 [Moraxellaceae bacterium]|jgi:Ca2+-binding RTX toxin-like protein|nr:hypothetical protein [Moraxellaceae bacterium]